MSKKCLIAIALVLSAVLQHAYAQIYKHQFGTTTINTHPYTVAPGTISPNLSNSSWQNSTNTWYSAGGSTGNAIQIQPPAGASTITLTFNVASGYVATFTGYDLWTRRSNTGPQNWEMKINGTSVGTGSVSTGGSATGTTNIATPVSGSGTITITLALTNASGSTGNMRLDDFTLYGTVTPLCNSVTVSSFLPANGPQNTEVTLNGSGFTNAASVKFDNINATFTVVSNTQIKAIVPAGVTTGTIVVTGADGCTGSPSTTFSILQSDCSTGDIYISEVYDELVGDPGAVEIYNPTNSTITFNGAYILERYSDYTDALPDPAYNIVLTGSIGPHQTYLVRCGSQTFDCTYANSLTYPMTMSGINDNDGLKIRKNGTIIDFVYAPFGTGTSGRGYTLIRKPNATAPSPNFILSEWDTYATEFCSNLGMHTAVNNSTPAPTVTQPQNQTACENGSTTFTASASGTGYTYQWKMLNASGNWVNVIDNTNYSGATTSTLTVANIPASFNNNQYYCLITSASCQVYSNAVKLTVGSALAAPTVTITAATCSAPVQATVTSPVGTGYTYSLDNGTYQTSAVFSGLTTGNHAIIAKDPAGCTTAPYNFTVQAAPSAPAVANTTPTQPTCTVATGSITINSPTGTGYEYSLNGGAYQTGTTFNNLAAGNYTITVQNADGCTSTTGNITINAQPATPAVADVTPTQPTCSIATGSITVNSPTGTGYEYSLNGGTYQTGTTFNNLTAGNYTISVKNADGCTSTTGTININAQPETPSVADVTPIQPTCSVATGTITINSPTGTGYEYSLNGGAYQTGTTFNNLAAGNYTITVQNVDGCTSTTGTITINAQPAAPAVANTTPTQPTCTVATGSITINSPTGAGYEYSLNGGAYQTGTTFSNLAAGNYSITVQNAEGCTSTTGNISINTQPATPSVADVTPTQPTCSVATGSITVNSPMGAGYEYSLNGGAYQTGTTFNNLAAGNYTITVQNADGCTSTTGNIIINAQPATPAVADVTPTQPTCTVATGSITVNSPTGAGYEYSLNGGTYQTATIFNNLAAGNYTITVQNADGCTSTTGNIIINAQPATPAVADVTPIQPTCSVSTGSITINSPTGAGYEYSINGGTYQTGTIFNNLSDGSYTVTTKNADGCTSVSNTVVIDTAPATPAVANTTPTQPTCTVATGSITINSPTGTGYEYSLNGGTYQTGTTFSNLAAGNYTITVQNAEGCTSTTGTITINTQPATPGAPDATVTQPTCTTTGSITIISPTGAGITYSINGTNYQASVTFTGLTAGTYNITAKSAAGCISDVTQKTINMPPQAPATPTVTVTQPTCAVPTGSFTITAPTGTDITYSINGATYQASNVFTGLAQGSYTITAKNANGCVSTGVVRTVNAAPASPVTPTLSPTQPTCSVATGSITVTAPTGATFTYSLNGSTYQSSPNFTGLASGNYNIVVKNNAGCTSAPQSVTINAAPDTPVTPDTTQTHPDCTVSTGSITIISPLGTDLTYSINSGTYQAATTFSNLNPGTYQVRVKNAAGCISAPKTVVINARPAIPGIPLTSVVQPTCAVPSGKITVTAPTGGYTYSIDGINFQASPVFTGLAGSTYTVTIQNSVGCTNISAPVTINNAPAPAPSPGTISGANGVCIKETVQLTASEANGTWSVSNTNLATVDANGLVTAINPGTVTVYYTVGTDCTASAQHSITIYRLPAPVLRDIYLCENSNGELSPRVLNSGLNNSEYTFTWKKDGVLLTDTTSSITVTETGQYSVEATGIASGCIGAATATVGASSIATATATVSEDFSNFQTITINVTGGSGDYEYSLDGGAYQDEPLFRGVYQGEYIITVRDKNGCGYIELTVFALNYPHYFSPNGDGKADYWTIPNLSDQWSSEIFIYDRFGKLITSIFPSRGNGWDGTLNGHLLPATDYWFSVYYTSGNGEKKQFKAHFSLVR